MKNIRDSKIQRYDVKTDTWMNMLNSLAYFLSAIEIYERYILSHPYNYEPDSGIMQIIKEKQNEINEIYEKLEHE